MKTCRSIVLGSMQLGLLGTMFMACAVAQEAVPESEEAEVVIGVSRFFEQQDLNEDGQVTIDEVSPESMGVYEQLRKVTDLNGDGIVTRQEWTEFERKIRGTGPISTLADPKLKPAKDSLAEQIIKQLDKNGDGKIELSELPESMRERFARLLEIADTNQDQAIDLEELRKASAVSRLLSDRAGPSAQSPIMTLPLPITEAEPMKQEQSSRPTSLIEALDLNNDGVISAAEIALAPNSLLRLDLNGDGELTPDELTTDKSRASEKLPQQTQKLPESMTPPGLLAPQPQTPAPASASELANDTVRIALQHLLQRDHDGDGKLRREDLPSFLAARFEELDTNEDGLLDVAELTVAVRQLPSRRVNIQGNPQQNSSQSSFEATIPLRAQPPKTDSSSTEN